MASPLWYFYSQFFFFFTSLNPSKILISKLLDFCCVQEKLYGRPITLADREMVEEKADKILSESQDSNVAFLVVGDPFGYSEFSFIIIGLNWLFLTCFCALLIVYHCG